MGPQDNWVVEKVAELTEFRIAGVGAKITVVGPDSTTYLQSQLSADLVGLHPESSTWSLLLEPNGRLVATLEVHKLALDTFEIITDARISATVIARLKMFLIRTKLSLSEPVLCDLVLGASDDDQGIDALVGKGNSWVETQGHTCSDVDIERWNAARARYFCPVVGVDLQEGSLPNVLGDLTRYASFAKGCYTGQELVERVESRKAQAPKRLYPFANFTDAVQEGETLYGSGDKALGSIAMVSAPLETLGSHFVTALGLPSEIQDASQLGFVLLARGNGPSDVDRIGDQANPRAARLVEIVGAS